MVFDLDAETKYMTILRQNCINMRRIIIPPCVVCQGEMRWMNLNEILKERVRNKKLYLVDQKGMSGSSPVGGAYCDDCGNLITTENWYHCTNKKTEAHQNGRDLCLYCGITVYIKYHKEDHRQDFRHINFNE